MLHKEEDFAAVGLADMHGEWVGSARVGGNTVVHTAAVMQGPCLQKLKAMSLTSKGLCLAPAFALQGLHYLQSMTATLARFALSKPKQRSPLALQQRCWQQSLCLDQQCIPSSGA